MKTPKKPGTRAKHGRGTGVPDPVDSHVGARIRTRRLLVGMNQETLAESLGLTFQQVQKYEGGANRVSASRLAETAEILGVRIGYFFTDLLSQDADPNAPKNRQRDLMHEPESLELVRLYYAISDQDVRRQFLDMVKTMAKPSPPSE